MNLHTPRTLANCRRNLERTERRARLFRLLLLPVLPLLLAVSILKIK